MATSSPQYPQQTTAPRRRVQNPTRWIVTAIIVAAAVWFILANRQTARIRLWVVDVNAAMWLVLLLTFVAGMATGWLLHRRGRRRTQ